MKGKLDILGALLAVSFYISAIMIFISRIINKNWIGYYIGYFEIVLICPFLFLFLKSQLTERPMLYDIQLVLIMIWLIVELLLDYILKINFRDNRFAVMAYVTLFFGASGGLIGIASNAGKTYTIIAVILFIIMACLAFFQRLKTGI